MGRVCDAPMASGFHRRCWPLPRRPRSRKPRPKSSPQRQPAHGATSAPTTCWSWTFATAARAVIQLAPEFAPVHVANIRALAKGGWWSGAAIYRVQDNYVVQWGNNESAKPLPTGVVAKPPAEYHRALKGLAVRPLGYADVYAPEAGFAAGLADRHTTPRPARRTSPIATAMSASARDLSPDTGTGGELYAVIGHAPRHLDRNIAVVGRVHRGHRPPELAAARNRGARLLQGRKPARADRNRSGWRARSRPPSARHFNLWTREARPSAAYRESARQPEGRFLHPAGRRRRSVQRGRAGAAQASLSFRPPRRCRGGDGGSCAG